jgi:hypothetical protein
MNNKNSDQIFILQILILVMIVGLLVVFYYLFRELQIFI